MADERKAKAADTVRKPLTWKRRLGLIAFGIGLIAALELLLRATGVSPPYRPADPLMGGGAGKRSYSLWWVSSGEHGYFCEWIRAGYPFNYQPIPEHKANNARRIFVFGGSSAVGYPYDGRLAFARFLEVGLQELMPQLGIEVYNVAQNAIEAGTCLRLMHEMADYEPDIFVVYSGNNEYSNRHQYRNIRRRGAKVAALRSLAGRLAIYRTVERLAAPARMRIYTNYLVNEEGVRPPAYSTSEREILLTNYSYVIEQMIEFCAARGIRLVLCTVASNAADWPPYRSTFSEGVPAPSRLAWLEGFEAALQAYERGDHDEALKTLGEIGAERIDDHRADYHYLRGKCLAVQGRHEEAWAAFRRALDLDNVCYRARPSHNDVVRRLAARRREVAFVDVVKSLRAEAKHGLLGENFFWDHCHPKPEAHRIIAREIARAVLDDRCWLPGPDLKWEDRFMAAVDRWRVSARITPAMEARACRDTAAGWQAVWTNHRAPDQLLRRDSIYVERALEYLNRAIELDRALGGTHFYRGVCHALLEDNARAMADWQKELALQSKDGPMTGVLEGLLNGDVPPDRGMETWLFIRNDMMR